MVWQMFNMVATNAGTSFEMMIVLIAVAGGLIFFAKGFQIGILINMIIFSGIFMWFYNASMNYAPPLIIMLLYIVILALSFYPMNKAETAGGII